MGASTKKKILHSSLMCARGGASMWPPLEASHTINNNSHLSLCMVIYGIHRVYIILENFW